MKSTDEEKGGEGEGKEEGEEKRPVAEMEDDATYGER